MHFAILFLLLLILAVELTWRGLRGYAIDDHPLCRKCGFDLSGLPKDSFKCSECGAGLLIHKAIRIGHRKRRRKSLFVGSVLLLLLLAVGGAGVWSQAQNIDYERWKPTWWVLHEAADRSAGAPLTPWNELTRRLQANSLSTAQMQRIAELA